ncbi:lipase [Sphingopyxis lindanitolerans]|uniref:Lipase n=1 Tax=Sphingopyxis lindanitolerans TaxID=2054227 RepID=A0A2S8B404_9SPHN|nr:alpha/beta hydrolase [Sphingopyxis lindanitolerans]PQM26999.1 lipase [Sphingopyxis lindanitolerans]
MPLHPEAVAFLEKMADVPDPTDENLELFRGGAATLIATGERADLCDVIDRTIAGGDRQDMGVRIYVPREEGPLPVILWVHGGSFVRGTLDMFDAGRRDFAHQSKCVIVAVDQRLSPEAQFPAPLEDAYAALIWTAGHMKEFKGDPALLGVGGESSGGSPAAALPFLAHERGGPKIAFQVLANPLLDATLSSPSVDELATGYFLTKAQLDWCYEKYAPGEKRKSPLVSPALQADFSTTVPAAIVTTEYDPVRDDGERFAESLRRANVPVYLERILGHVHHFGGADRTPALLRLLNALLSDLRAVQAKGA